MPILDAFGKTGAAPLPVRESPDAPPPAPASPKSIGTDAATVEPRAIEVCGPAAGEQTFLVVPPRLG